LEYPAGLAFDSGGNLWVADSGNNRVLRYTPANLVTGGAASIAIGQPNLNTGTWVGPADNTFQDPMGVAFDGSGDIWVADYADSRVMGFMPGGSNAVTGGWATWILGQANPSGYSGNQGGLFGNGVAANSLDYPVGLAFDSHGNLWVADDANNRILEYLTPNCYSNDGLASIVLGQPSLSVKNANQGGGASSTALYSPYYLAFDSSGDLWASDASNSRVLEYLPSNFVTDGAAALVIGQANFAASSSNQGGSVAANTLSGPGGIALDHSGNLWIVDRGNSRVLEYLIP
jgi:secreted PhoX family phosphatase